MTTVTTRIQTRHFVLDLETTNIVPSAAIVSIGCARISKQVHPGEAQYVASASYPDSFYEVMNLKDQFAKGLTKDQSTIEFWSTVSEDAREAYDAAHNIDTDPKETLTRFFNWMRGPIYTDEPDISESPVVWGNSPSFDCVILRYVMETYGLTTPWVFRNERDVRTATNLLKQPVPRTINAKPHHALYDAVAEARWLIEVNKQLPDTMSLFL